MLDDPQININQSWLDGYEFEYYVHWKVVQCGYRLVEIPVTKTYPSAGVPYTKIVPFVGWWHMLRPFLLLFLGLRKKQNNRLANTAPAVKRCLEVGTRRIAHFNVTVNPTATWTLQQFREVMMDAPSYRFVLHDRDRISQSHVSGLRAQGARQHWE